MLSLAAFAALSGPRSPREDEAGYDPGIFSLVGLFASALSEAQSDARDSAAAALIAQNGSQLSDDVERRISARFIAAPF